MKAEYIGADQLPSFVFRLQLCGGPSHYVGISPPVQKPWTFFVEHFFSSMLAAHLCCGRGIQPDGRCTGMGEVEISEDGASYPVVDFHRLAQRYGVAHQRL